MDLESNLSNPKNSNICKDGTLNCLVAQADSSTTNSTQTPFLQIKQWGFKQYYFLPILILVILAYISTYFLIKVKKISLMQHRMFWNWIMLCAFIWAMSMGVLLLLRINYWIILNLPFTLLFWHVIFGEIFFSIALFHIFWHQKIFAATFKKKAN